MAGSGIDCRNDAERVLPKLDRFGGADPGSVGAISRGVEAARDQGSDARIPVQFAHFILRGDLRLTAADILDATCCVRRIFTNRIHSRNALAVGIAMVWRVTVFFEPWIVFLDTAVADCDRWTLHILAAISGNRHVRHFDGAGFLLFYGFVSRLGRDFVIRKPVLCVVDDIFCAWSGCNA